MLNLPIQAISLRRNLLSSIAHSISGVHRRSTSENLREKLTLLMQNPSSVSRALQTEDYNLNGRNDCTSAAGFEGSLWNLLQQRLLDPAAWPRWSDPILKVSNLNLEHHQESNMLDEPWLDPTGFAKDQNDDGYVTAIQLPAFDDRPEFDIDESLIDVPYDQNTSLNGVLTADSGGDADEVDFWSALDDDPYCESMDEMLLEDVSMTLEDIAMMDEQQSRESSKDDHGKSCCHHTPDGDPWKHNSCQSFLEKAQIEDSIDILDESTKAVFDDEVLDRGLEVQPLYKVVEEGPAKNHE